MSLLSLHCTLPPLVASSTSSYSCCSLLFLPQQLLLHVVNMDISNFIFLLLRLVIYKFSSMMLGLVIGEESGINTTSGGDDDVRFVR